LLRTAAPDDHTVGRPRWSGIGRLERRLAAATAAAIAVAALIVLVSGAPVAWLLLAITGASSAAVLARGVLQRRYFEPLTIVAAVTFVSFSIRPLQLFLSVKDLLSWFPATNLDAEVLTLDQSETAQFVAQRLTGDLEPALTRAMAGVTLFFLLFVVGYSLPVARGLRRRISRVGTRVAAFDAGAVAAVCLGIGLTAQLVALVLAGGPDEAFKGQIVTKVLEAGSPLFMHFLMGFSTIGLVIWAIWRRPVTPLARIAFAAAALEIIIFWSLVGTRTRVLLPLLMLAIVSHEIWRPWRRRTVLLGLVAGILLGSALLSVRQASVDQSFGGALLQAPQYVVNPEGIVNDFTEFDIFFYATSLIPEERGYAHGQGLLDAFKSYVPGALIANKPQSTDQEFGKLVWGHSHWGGRPYTAVGDFYNDFGFPGIAVCAVLFGVVGRLLLSLLRAPPGLPGRRYRVGLYAIGTAVFYIELATDYALTIGFFIEYALPFLLAVHVFGPAISRLRPRVREVPGEEPEPVPAGASIQVSS
jgi:hypothetical protein